MLAAGPRKRAGTVLEQFEEDLDEIKAVAAALGAVKIGWRLRGRVIVLVADMPHAVKKVRQRATNGGRIYCARTRHPPQTGRVSLCVLQYLPPPRTDRELAGEAQVHGTRRCAGEARHPARRVGGNARHARRSSRAEERQEADAGALRQERADEDECWTGDAGAVQDHDSPCYCRSPPHRQGRSPPTVAESRADSSARRARQQHGGRFEHPRDGEDAQHRSDRPTWSPTREGGAALFCVRGEVAATGRARGS